MKQNSSTVSGADHIDAADADVLTALTTSGGDAEATTPSRGLARHVSSLTGAAVLAIAAAVLAVGLAGGAASATAASIPESEPLAAADAEDAVDAVPAGTPEDVDLESGPIHEGRWEYALAPVQWAQRDAVLAANVTPAPQPAGYGWALVELSVRNTGSVSATPGRFEVLLHTGGWTVSHLDVGRQPIRMPAEFTPHELQPGEQETGNLGFWLPDHAAGGSDCVIEVRAFAKTDASYTSHWLSCS